MEFPLESVNAIDSNVANEEVERIIRNFRLDETMAATPPWFCLVPSDFRATSYSSYPGGRYAPVQSRVVSSEVP